MSWWKTFFDTQYYGPSLDELPHERNVSEVDFILWALKLNKRAAILDLCCGVGRHAAEIARRGFRVTGLDYNEQYLETARRRVHENGAAATL